MDKPLPARSLNEARYYFLVIPCPSCGRGPWIIDSEQPSAAGQSVAITAHCKACRAEGEFSFACRNVSAPDKTDDECINLTNSPSELIDLGQWLSLYSLMLESAASADLPYRSHQYSYRAALCLCEALKFYSDDELPDKSAFFSHASDLAFVEHPENFARQRLRDMLSKLPTDHQIDPAPHHAAGEPHKWWQIWKNQAE